jgi:Xaa-Pro aminopeptidase
VKQSEIFTHLPRETSYFLITNLKNIQFLTGFSGDWAVLVLSKKKRFLITDSRFTEQATRETEKCDIITVKRSLSHHLKSIIRKSKKVAFEANDLRYSQYRRIKKHLQGRRFTPTIGIIARLRMIKTPQEIKNITKAATIADYAFGKIRKSIRIGVRELDIASELEYILRQNGSEAHPFPTIAISSANTSLPHGQPGMRKVKKGDLFLLDYGATYKGYCSDITRTVVVGKATKKQKNIYSLVLRAQRAALNAIKPGGSLKDIDKTARDIIAGEGFGKNFGHGLGHGIGLEVHEYPNVSYRSKDRVQNGMVFTIEPGIYIPRWGGIRIEDDVAIVKGEKKILTKSPKSTLIEV